MTTSKRTQQQLESLLEAAPNIIVRVNCALELEFVNRVEGVPRDRVLGAHVATLMTPEDSARVIPLLEQVLRDGVSVEYEVAPNQGLYQQHFQCRAGAIRDGDNIVGITIVITDISSRIRLENQLAATERMASLGSLAAGVAHEISNPLTYVLANLSRVDKAVRDGDSDIAIHRLQQASQGAERIRNLLRDISTLARPESSRPGCVDPLPVLASAVRMVSAEVRGRGRLINEFGPLPLVRATPSRLAQVFVNLLVNAAQALPVGQDQEQFIRLKTFTSPQGEAVIEVADSGPGIDEKFRQRVFEPFFTTRDQGGGSGLGLYLCRNIVASFGGSITADIDEGGGALFRVVLPGVSPPAVGFIGEAKILMVDADTSTSLSVKQWLGEDAVTSARSLREAALRIQEADFEVILCDLELPGKAPGEVVNVMSEQSARVVFTSTNRPDGTAGEFVRSQPERFLRKPYTVDELLQTIERALTVG